MLSFGGTGSVRHTHTHTQTHTHKHTNTHTELNPTVSSDPIFIASAPRSSVLLSQWPHAAT